MNEKFNKFYLLYKDEVFSYAYRILENYYDALDVVQDVFFRFYKHLNKIEESKVKHWLFKVCHNIIIERFRKQKKIYNIEEFEETLSSRETIDIERLLISLPPNYR